jgi:hypothetical protein
MMEKMTKTQTDKYAVIHFTTGYNTHRKNECSVDNWFKCQEHIRKNPKLLGRK